MSLNLSISRLGLSGGRGGEAPPFNISFTGLSTDSLGTYGQVGNHAAISYTISPDLGTETVKWSNSSNPADAATFGTGANPTDFTASDGATVYLHVTYGGDTVTRSFSARFSADQALAYGTRLGQGVRTWFNYPQTFGIGSDRVLVAAAGPDAETSTGAGTSLLYDWDVAAETATLIRTGGNNTINDHNEGGVTRLASGNYIWAPFGHNTGAPFLYRGSNLNALTEVSLDASFGKENYSYSNVIQLDGVANDPVYIFGRGDPGGNWSHFYSVSTDDGATWSAYTAWLKNPTERPYVKYFKSSATRIEILLTTGHPNEVAGANRIYHGYFEGGSFYKSDGTEITASLPLAPTEFTEIHDGTNNGWIWDIKVIGGDIYVLYTTFPTTTEHRYHRAIYSGGSWTTETIVSDAGSGLYSPEVYYSGGMIHHPTDPDVVFACVEVAGVYQLTQQDKSTGSWVQTVLTEGSGRSFRPVTNTNPPALTWIYEEKTDGAFGYDTFVDFKGCFLYGVSLGSGAVPEAFTAPMWSVATGNAGELNVTIARLPASSGPAVSDIEYDLDASGTWVSSGGRTSFVISGLTESTSYDVRLRAVSTLGNSAPGNTETATSGAPASAPDAFIDANWSVATGAVPGGQLDVTIATLPASNGADITDVEYDLDASGTWISSGGTASFTITGLTTSTSYAVRLRAVNSSGAGTAGNSESATSSKPGFTDNFNRANESLTASANWVRSLTVASTAAADIVSNALRLSAAAGSRGIWQYSGTTANDQTAQVTISSGFSTSPLFAGIVVRDTSSGSTRSCYGLFLNNDVGNNWQLGKFVSGSFTELAAGTLGSAVSAGQKFRVRSIGSTISADVDTGSGWTSLGSVTDSSHTSGKAGVYWGFGAGNIVYDDFSYINET